MQRASLLFSVLLVVGCAPAYVQPPPSADHPANPEAAQASFVMPPDLLAPSGVDAMNAMEDRAGMNHGGMTHMNHGDKAEATPMQPQDATGTLPDEAAEPLRQLLDAYMSIGDRLASDTIEGIAEQAQQIGPTLEALVKVDLPDKPHLWHESADDLQTIREQALALAGASDLSAARIAYGVLSDALERLITATGVPEGYDEAAFRYVCGMFADAPRKGVWLQFGDDARNPYLGSRMPGCYSEQAPLPKAGSESPPKPVMEQHQHEHQPRQGGHR